MLLLPLNCMLLSLLNHITVTAITPITIELHVAVTTVTAVATVTVELHVAVAIGPHVTITVELLFIIHAMQNPHQT